jgi:hypothetical protein
MLLCYDYQNGITNEEDIIFATQPKLFSIGTISLPDTFQFVRTIKSSHKNTEINNHNTKLSNKKSILIEGKTINRYELVVAIDKKCIQKVLQTPAMECLDK